MTPWAFLLVVVLDRSRTSLTFTVVLTLVVVRTVLLMRNLSARSFSVVMLVIASPVQAGDAMGRDDGLRRRPFSLARTARAVSPHEGVEPSRAQPVRLARRLAVRMKNEFPQ